jgi:hypothetical protein
MLQPAQHLPNPVIRSIVRRARSRLIPGTNLFALVCRAWRDAGSIQEDQEQLQLLLDIDNLCEADVATALAWLKLHGSCLTGLSISSELQPCWSIMEQLVVSADVMGNQLTRLELLGEDTLLPLVPHLLRLPHLQHLKASITATMLQQQGFTSMAWTLGKSVEEAPDLGQLCPQLAGLHLVVGGHGLSLPAAPTVKHPLSKLLPTSLRELHLEAERDVADCALLTHLISLARLTISASGSTHVRCGKPPLACPDGRP